MDKFTVPEKYRKEFERALDVAVELGSFTDKSLAEKMNVSPLNAAIFIGFMDKCGFIFPSLKNEVKTVRITPLEWDALGRNIDAYTPPPEETALPEFKLTPFERLEGINRVIEKSEEGVIITAKNDTHFIPADEVTLPHLKKAKLFSRGFIYFGEVCPKNAREALASFTSLSFSRKTNAKAEAFVESILADLEKKL